MADVRAVVVARRAAELALAAGVDLHHDLALWRLAGGRPDVEARSGQPDELGDVLEAAFTGPARQVNGAHYTPASLAAELVDRAIGARREATVGDPACGGGALLLAAARHLASMGHPPSEVLESLWGVDIDPVAVATTEVALTIWAGAPPPVGHILVGDALAGPVPWPSLDVVIGNPPFLSQLDATTARDQEAAARLRARFGAAVRAYTDTASLFLLAACDLAAPGGTVALLQPQSVLAARDAAGVREAVAARGRVVDVWFPVDRGFSAAVDVCLPIIEMGTAEPSGSWSRHLARANGVPLCELHTEMTVADVAQTTAAFRSEYYGMVDHVKEQEDLLDGIPLVTTGLVDLGGCAWGERSARVGGRAWNRPVLDVGLLEGRALDWAQRTAGPKVVVATQTRVMEVVVDEVGSWIPGVPLVVVLAPPDQLWPVASALASPAVTAWVLERTAGTALAPHALKVTAALLREVPLPSDDAAWAAGTDAFRAGDIDGFVAAMASAYGVGHDVGGWWIERARSVWSPTAVPR